MSTRGQRRGQGEPCVRTQPSLDLQKSQRPQSAAGSWGGDKKRREKPLEARWVQSLGVLIEPPASSPGDSRDGCFTRVVPAR